MTINIAFERPVPLGDSTVTSPLLVPTGTTAVIVVSETTVNAADTSVNLTAVAVVKFEPVIVMVVPTWPEVGAKTLISGASGRIVNVLEVPVPPALGRESQRWEHYLTAIVLAIRRIGMFEIHQVPSARTHAPTTFRS